MNCKAFENKCTPLCLSNISKDFTVVNMERTWVYGYLNDCSVDYDSMHVDDF